MSGIADFLRAQYAERRAIAEAAAALQCDPENGWGVIDSSSYAEPEKRRWISPHIGMLHESESAEHVVANNPAVVIADLDAKLALVDVHDRPHRCPAYDQYGDGPRFVDPTPQQVTDCCTTLRILAQPYAGHPDHKGEEWAP